jgi:hypothetical protein
MKQKKRDGKIENEASLFPPLPRLPPAELFSMITSVTRPAALFAGTFIAAEAKESLHFIDSALSPDALGAPVALTALPAIECEPPCLRESRELP